MLATTTVLHLSYLLWSCRGTVKQSKPLLCGHLLLLLLLPAPAIVQPTRGISGHGLLQHHRHTARPPYVLRNLVIVFRVDGHHDVHHGLARQKLFGYVDSLNGAATAVQQLLKLRLLGFHDGYLVGGMVGPK